MIEVNGRTYALRDRPVVGVCLDGCDQEYLDAAEKVMPNLQTIQRKGSRGLVDTATPSYTNPNNLAIVTGTTPDANGIAGNYYYDVDGDEEVMMNDPSFLRAPTILAAWSDAGRSVAAVTTKDKLRLLLGKGLTNGICFSIECAHEATVAEHGISNVCELVGRKNPGIYDPEASVFCLEAGVRLLKERSIDLVYLSTTDFVQHKYEPGSQEANEFYSRLDHFLGELDALDPILGITADHGMNAKVKADGTPKVEYLESWLSDQGFTDVRVILPITDPYVIHHGGLGSYATIYVDKLQLSRAAEVLSGVPGVELVLTRDEAVERFHLPPDRIGDLVVLSDKDTVLGRTPEWHDLTAVASGLRSHGGMHEAVVPMILNRPLKRECADQWAARQLRNFDLFDILCNGTKDE